MTQVSAQNQGATWATSGSGCTQTKRDVRPHSDFFVNGWGGGYTRIELLFSDRHN